MHYKGEITVQHRHGLPNGIVSKSIWQGMYNCTVFLLNCQGMEPHLGLEFNGAFGAEFALNKAVSLPSQSTPS